ncbi:unnamed protein product [Closterium sp. NIES-54]
MLALCREHKLEHITKHIALRYFLARELQQRGQLRLAYVASEANTADIFTKALPPCDHQRFCTMLGFPTSAARAAAEPPPEPPEQPDPPEQPEPPEPPSCPTAALPLHWLTYPDPTCCAIGRTDSLFDLTSGVSPALPATADSTVRSQGPALHPALLRPPDGQVASPGEVTEVLIDWIRAARLRLRESFGSDFHVLRLHSDRGGEFSSALLGAFCCAQGIRQTFTLPASPQQNGIAERRIGMVMDVARTSMIHAAAPHFLWPFAVQYAAHQLNLQPQVSLPETSPTLLWTGKVGDASAFRVWGSRAFVRDLSADKLSPRATPCVFFGFPPDAPGFTTPPRVVFCPPRTSPSTSRCLTTVSSPTALRLSPRRRSSLH